MFLSGNCLILTLFEWGSCELSTLEERKELNIFTFQNLITLLLKNLDPNCNLQYTCIVQLLVQFHNVYLLWVYTLSLTHLYTYTIYVVKSIVSLTIECQTLVNLSVKLNTLSSLNCLTFSTWQARRNSVKFTYRLSN